MGVGWGETHYIYIITGETEKVYCSEISPPRPSGKGRLGKKVKLWGMKKVVGWEEDCGVMGQRRGVEQLRVWAELKTKPILDCI
jgi:hypothetical protein